MIRARRVPRPDSCCTSADVMTPTERVVDRPREFAKRAALVYRDGSKTWGDDPEIRAILLTLRATL